MSSIAVRQPVLRPELFYVTVEVRERVRKRRKFLGITIGHKHRTVTKKVTKAELRLIEANPNEKIISKTPA